jgi:hypothetical protein
MNAVPKLTVVSHRDRALDALVASPAARKAEVELAAQTLATRKGLFAELSKLDEAAARDLPKLQADVAAARADFQEAQKRFYGDFHNPVVRASAAAAGILAQAKLNVAQHESMVASFAYSARRDAVERELRRTASPAIALFVREMRDAWHATRSATVETRSHLVKNPITRRTSESIESNAASISRRLIGIRAAIDAAESMALEPDQANIDIRLEKIRQALPAIGGPELPK